MDRETGLRRMKMIAIGSAMLDEDDGRSFGAESGSEQVDPLDQAIAVVTRGGKQAPLHVHDDKGLPAQR